MPPAQAGWHSSIITPVRWQHFDRMRTFIRVQAAVTETSENHHGIVDVPVAVVPVAVALRSET